MKITIALVALAGLLVPASPALAQTPGTATVPTPAGPVLVARWTFDGGAVGGKVADTSGRGSALTIRVADQGVIRFQGGYLAFPAVCATESPCARGLLEAPDAADLNPGVRMFRWSARVNVTKAQLKGSANVMQKGVATTGSQWKLQIGATQGRAQCVLTGVGSSTVYLARSAGTVADGVWHKLLCQRSGTSLAVYVDGVQRGQTTVPASLSVSNSLPLRIGGPNFNTHSDMYHGLLDDVYAELG